MIVSHELVNQLRNVIRLVSNNVVILFDNSGFEYSAKIDSYNKDSVCMSILDKKENMVLFNKNIYLVQSIIKKDKFEWIVEKATELGVSHIFPVLSERSEKKDLNMDRLNKIAIEASEQSGRSTVPTINSIISLEEAINEIKKVPKILSIVFHTSGKKLDNTDDNIAIFIGPEGGWSEKEIGTFNEANIPIVSLGKQILRAETAAISAIAKLIL